MSKEDIYRAIALQYKMSYNDIAKLNPFQQLSMLQLGGESDNRLHFESEAEYQAYLRKR